jgi:hypothetical protein
MPLRRIQASRFGDSLQNTSNRTHI